MAGIDGNHWGWRLRPGIEGPEPTAESEETLTVAEIPGVVELWPTAGTDELRLLYRCPWDYRHEFVKRLCGYVERSNEFGVPQSRFGMPHPRNSRARMVAFRMTVGGPAWECRDGSLISDHAIVEVDFF